MPKDEPISFKTRQAWSAWLERNHQTSPGVWVRLAKKASAVESIAYPEAVEVALCYGWIDGAKKGAGDQTWLQRFVPRTATSLWSRINREKALALVEAGHMKPAGLAAMEQARKNGRWDNAYDPPSRATVPGDFQAALNRSPGAQAFFDSLDKANRYAVLFRIQTVKKPETRARRILEFIAMLERSEKIHPTARTRNPRRGA
jgi:uncharacterized protein YdeI (YjbR/CyaY-like superfamily)